MVQTCIVHLIRAANRWVAYSDRKNVSCALRKVYTAVDETGAKQALDECAESELGQKYPQSVRVLGMRGIGSYRFCKFPPMARKVIYTTNSIESFNNKLAESDP